jgi:DNA-directed RNA polymerase specialized sigma24 family protein
MASLTELIAAAQHGDGEAYGRIVERFQDMAYYTAYRYLGEQQPAQDAAQDAFIEAYRCLPALESPLAFTAWFRRIIFKQCDRQARSRQPLHLDDDMPGWRWPPTGPAPTRCWNRCSSGRPSAPPCKTCLRFTSR